MQKWCCYGLIIATLLVSSGGEPSRAAIVDRYWESTPYKTQVVVLIDASTLEARSLQATFDDYLPARTDAAVGPLWNATFDVRQRAADGQFTRACDASLASLSDTDQASLDKLVVVAIKHDASGYVVECREYDFFVRAWGNAVRESSSTIDYVPELAFRLMTSVFAPVATYRVDRDDEGRVFVSFKASALPQPPGGANWTPPGTLLAPILRKSDTSGRALADGIDRVKWTYLMISADEPAGEIAKVYSHTRRPFGFRQRGRVDQLAIAVRGEPQPVTVRLHNRNDPNERLGGFDVYLQNQDETETRLLGRTDSNGEVVVPPGPTPIQTAYIKSGAVALAKLPLVPGDLPVIEAPLPDHRQRLEAEAKLALIREQLIDVVARRAIMAARISRFVADGDTDTARQILEQFDNLPGRSQFDAMLTKEQQLVKTNDAAIAKQIDTLYDNTRAVLNEFLDSSISGQLRSKILAAEAGEAPSATAEEERG